MDDIAFFDTKPYEHRGGIYGECLRKASSLRGEAVDGMEPAVDTEEGQLMPGVPNPKLGDPKEESGEQGRQRHARARKSSGTESILSTKSAPLGAAGPEKPSSFNLSSWGTSTSLETHSHEHRQHHHKHKDHDHSRKRSWFTSSPAVSKSKLGATESDSALPLPDTKGSEVAAVKPQNKSAGEELVRKSHSTTALPAAAAESSDAAVERLRGILEAGKSQSTPPSSATNAANFQQSKVFSAGLDPEAVLTASPEPSLYKTSSGSSVDTTHAAIASAARPSAAKTSEAETGERSHSNLVRHESGRSTSSSKSAESSQDRPALQPDNASIASGHDGSSSASVFSNSSTSSNIAILQNWKTKATDKQAIQASVSQARDAMSRWGNKWQAYRKAHQTANQGDDEHRKLNDDIPQLQQENVGTSGSILHRDGKLTPETRSRSSSLISSSPTGHFQPSAATTTTSLSGVTGPSIDTTLGSKAPSQRSPVVRRVPPPSAVPVHPAVGQQNSEQPAPPKRQSYTPAPMMSIPGIDASRRFHASSADASLAKGPPPLPSRDAVTAEQKPATPTRVPVPSNDTAAKASSESPRDVSASPARSSPPPLPVRPAAVAASVTDGLPEPEAGASAATPPDTVSSLQQSRVRNETAATSPTTSMRVPNNETSPAVIIQPPTPAPEAEATFDQQDILDNGSEPVADDPVRPNVVV